MQFLDAQQWEQLHHDYIAHGIRIGKERLVVSAAIVCDGKILLVRRSEEDSYAGSWEFPGGGVDEDEMLVEAIKREVQEETGIELPDHPIAEVLTHTTSTALRVVVQYELPEVPKVRLSHEHDAYQFFDKNQLKRNNEADMELFETLRPENQAVVRLLLEPSLGREL